MRGNELYPTEYIVTTRIDMNYENNATIVALQQVLSDINRFYIPN
jgi:hypothetical protein